MDSRSELPEGICACPSGEIDGGGYCQNIVDDVNIPEIAFVKGLLILLTTTTDSETLKKDQIRLYMLNKALHYQEARSRSKQGMAAH